MFKKLALVAVALAIAVPAFAKGFEPPKQVSGIFQNSDLTNKLTFVGTTGGSTKPTFDFRGGGSKGGSVTIGADVSNMVNTVAVDCGCLKGLNVHQNSDLKNILKLTGTSTSGDVTIYGAVANIVNTVGKVL